MSGDTSSFLVSYEGITNTNSSNLTELYLNGRLITSLQNVPNGNNTYDILQWDASLQQYVVIPNTKIVLGKDSVSTHNNTILLNATGGALSTDGTNRLYIAPIRNIQFNAGFLLYDFDTKEVSYSLTVPTFTTSGLTISTLNNTNPNRLVVSNGSKQLISSSYNEAQLGILSNAQTWTAQNTFSSSVVLGLGSVGAPSLRFDSDTGLYSTGDGNLDISTNGTRRLNITDRIRTYGYINSAIVGSPSNPNYAFDTDHDTGMYQTATQGELNFSCNAQQIMNLSTSGVIIPTLNADRLVLTNNLDRLVSSSYAENQLGILSNTQTWSGVNTFSNTFKLSNLTASKLLLIDNLNNVVSSSYNISNIPILSLDNTFTGTNTFNTINMNTGSRLELASGTLLNPSLIFTGGGIYTGIWSGALNTIHISTNANTRCTITDSGLSVGNLTGGTTKIVLSDTNRNLISSLYTDTDMFIRSNNNTVSGNNTFSGTNNFTGTVSGITQTMVGLSNVDNTSDINKPVSNATQTQLDFKAPLASPTFTGQVTVASGTVALPSLVIGNNSSGIYSTGAGTINISTNGVQRMNISTSTFTLSTPLSSNSSITTTGGITTNTLTIQSGGIISTPASSQLLLSLGTGIVTDALLLKTTGISTRLGNAATPAFTFIDRPNTGIYSSASNTINFSCGATPVFKMDDTSITSYEPIRSIRGTVTEPAYSFTDSTNTGMFSTSGNNIDFTSNGNTVLRLNNTEIIGYEQFKLENGTVSSPIYSFIESTNTGLYRTTNTINMSVNGTRHFMSNTTGDVFIGIGTQTGTITPTVNGGIYIGNNTGNSNNKTGTIFTPLAIGYQAAQKNQGGYTVAIGRDAGRYNQGDYGVAIGYGAGQGVDGGQGQHTSTVIINATSGVLNSGGINRCYIAPLRAATAPLTAVQYDTTTKELVTYSSTRRLKKNIEPKKINADDILKLNIVEFDSIEDDTHNPCGLIAEECYDINPEFVCLDGEGLPISINYFTLMLYSIEKNKQQEIEIQSLKTTIANMKTKMDENVILQRLEKMEAFLNYKFNF